MQCSGVQCSAVQCPNRYTRLEYLTCSHTVFLQFSFCRKCRFRKPLFLFSADRFNKSRPIPWISTLPRFCLNFWTKHITLISLWILDVLKKGEIFTNFQPITSNVFVWPHFKDFIMKIKIQSVIYYLEQLLLHWVYILCKKSHFTIKSK